MNLQTHLIKAYSYTPTLSKPELSRAITEAAYNTSSLLQEIGKEYTNNPTYRNVYVTHPTIEDAMEGAVIPPSTVQTYTTTGADFSKTSSSIELTNEVLDMSKFDIESNTAMLVGNVLASKVSEIVIADILERTPDGVNPPAEAQEQVRLLKSGIAGEWGGDIQGVFQFLSDALKSIPDVYDRDSKLFLNKNNFVDFASTVTAEGEQVWLIQGGLLLGRYECVICDQLDDDTMLFGSLGAAFDLVAMEGNQTVDPITKPDVLKITETNKFANVAKDTGALIAMKAEVIIV
ncbi:Phage capsid family protein [Grimontia celer]|uniref:Phage capsid family protein n=1 Tax=Grimontia celer TaxID=1796497 RepID=A0A128EWN8_9GAMM|nr:phage major capsid protein [Grimontia celer]CZF78979.1 Phage capsid family protein [Grimontia celer]